MTVTFSYPKDSYHIVKLRLRSLSSSLSGSLSGSLSLRLSQALTGSPRLFQALSGSYSYSDFDSEPGADTKFGLPPPPPPVNFSEALNDFNPLLYDF